MKSKNILIISVSAGSGHVRAAEAVEAHAKRLYPNWQVTHIDMVDFVSAPTRKLFFESYEKLATELPRLWGFFYNSIDVPKRRRQFDAFANVIKKLEAKKFIAKVNEIEPDAIISTHFMPPDVLMQHKDALEKMPKLMTVITDYAVHELWIKPGVDHYFVATEKMKWSLTHRGVDAGAITVSGIPVDPVFAQTQEDRSQNEKKTILLLSGGQGMAGIDEIVESLIQSDQPLRIIAVAGKNTKLLQKLLDIKAPNHISIEPLGWIDNVHHYMHAADVVVTKPGGMSVSESITARKPIIAIRPIPGQEEHNVEFLLEHGLGVVAHSPEDLLYYLEQDSETIAPGLKNKKAQPEAGKTILDTIAHS